GRAVLRSVGAVVPETLASWRALAMEGWRCVAARAGFGWRMRSALLGLPQPLQIAIAQLRLPGTHGNGASFDPDLLGERGDFQRVAAPQDQIRRQSRLDPPAALAETEDPRRLRRERSQRCVVG